MLTDSRVLQQLRELLPEDGSNGFIYMIYGDPAYPQSRHLFGGFRNPPAGSVQAAWNTQMSKVREVVEWMFKEVIVQYRYLDFKNSMKIFKEPIALYYTVGVFFTNIRNTIYGGETSNYFNCRKEDMLSMNEYLNLLTVAELQATLDDDDN